MLNNTKKILIPLPSYGVDPSQISIPYKLLVDTDYNIVFATPTGQVAKADARILTGKGLGLLRSVIAARKDAVEAYVEMEKSVDFQNPISYADINPADYYGVILPGGHDKRVKEYLESDVLQSVIVAFFNANKHVGAIGHGVVLVARSIDPNTRASVIHEYATTAFLEKQEMYAYNLTRLWLGDYFLTYPGMTVEKEVTHALIQSKYFVRGPDTRKRDNYANLNHGFMVRDRNYISARWAGDMYNFSLGYVQMLQEI